MKNILKNLIISIVFLFILFGQKNVINVNASENSDIIINAIQNEIMDYSKDAVDEERRIYEKNIAYTCYSYNTN